MSTTTSNNLPPIFPEEQQFDGENFTAFKDRVLLAARARGATGYLTGNIKKPTEPLPTAALSPEATALPPDSSKWSSPYPSYDEWESRDAWTLSLVAYNTKNPTGVGIKLTGSAAEAWEVLTSQYGTISEIAAVAAEGHLRSTKLAEGVDFQEHIRNLRTKWRIATEKGAEVTDKTFRAIVISSLPSSWNTIVSSLYSTKMSSELVAGLTVHWDLLKGQNETAGVSSTALQAKVTPGRSSSKSDLLCSNTKNCGRKGHLIKDCYWPGGGKEGQFPPNFRGRKPTSTADDTSTTPTANLASTDPPPTPSHTVYALMAAQYAPAALYDEHNEAIDTYLSSSALALKATTKVYTYADSGASDHCFVDRSAFTDYERYGTPRRGQAADRNGSFSIVGRGTVKKMIKTGDTSSELVFRAALHTPDLSANLISIAKFDEAGFFITFGGGKVTFKDGKGRLVVEGVKTSGLYLLGTLDPNAGLRAPTVMAAKSLNMPVSLDTWHRRFGHAGVTGIRNLAKKGLVDGLEIKGGLDIQGLCEDCVYGKHAARVYDGVVEPEVEVNYRVHMDLWGPASVMSLGGAVYLMLCVDGGTPRMCGFPLSRKDANTTLAAFKTYHRESELQTGKRIHFIRIDGGREWLNEMWYDYCRESGIQLEVSMPYAHGQNGLAERSIRTVIEGVRCMMAEGGLPKYLWAELSDTSTTLRNFLPSSRHLDTVPEEKWTGERQEVSHFRPLGCVAFAKVPLELVASKLDARSVKCVMIGYSPNGYKLFDRNSCSIIASRDVIFEEGTGHRSLTILSDEDDLLSSIAPPPNPAVPGVLLPKQPTAARIRPTDPPLHPSTPPAAAPNTPNASDSVPEPPAPLRRSARHAKPTPAIIASEASRAEEEEARAAGKDWATDNEIPHGLLAAIGAFAFLASHDAAVDRSSDTYVPKHYGEAMQRPDLWLPPMEAELAVLEKKKVFRLVDESEVPAGKKIIGCMWVFANKYDADGNITRRKGRLVAKGYTQVHGEDFDETYAAVVRLESLRICIALAAHMGFYIWQIDFVSAYLNSVPTHEVYMRVPPGFQGGEGKVCLLLKTLYGMMQGGHDWYHTLDGAFSKLGYTTSRADSCVRVRALDDAWTITNTYGDDIFGISSSKAVGDLAKGELMKSFEAKDLGEPSFLLGMRIEQDPHTHSISLSQRTYLERVLQRFGMTDCNPHPTPLPSGIQLTEMKTPISEADKRFMEGKPYREVLGSLMWAQVATRPDLSYAVGVLARYQSNPGPMHWNAMMHVLGYVKGTLGYRITYRHRRDGANLKPAGYVDADYGGDLDTRRSTAGYVFMMSGGPVSWSSKQQATVALSTTEAEYMALTRGAQQALWMDSFLLEVSAEQGRPAMLYGDNLSSIALAGSTKGHSRAKHIDIRHHYIRERVSSGDIEIIHIPSQENIADLFTKSLPRATHDYIVKLLNMA